MMKRPRRRLMIALAPLLLGCSQVDGVSITVERPPGMESGLRRLLITTTTVDRGATPGYCLYLDAPGGLSYDPDAQGASASMTPLVCPTGQSCRLRVNDRGSTSLVFRYVPVCSPSLVQASLYQGTPCDGRPGNAAQLLEGDSAWIAVAATRGLGACPTPAADGTQDAAGPPVQADGSAQDASPGN